MTEGCEKRKIALQISVSVCGSDWGILLGSALSSDIGPKQMQDVSAVEIRRFRPDQKGGIARQF
jgi:hypothetical protein